MKIAGFDFSPFKQDVARIGEKIRKVRTDLVAARDELESTTKARIPRNELADLVCGWIDQEASGYHAGLGNILRNANGPEWFAKGARPNFFTTSSFEGVPNIPNQLAFFCLLREPIKTGIRQAIMAMPYPEEGLPIEERKKAIARLGLKIAELAAQEQEFESVLAELRKELA